ncbi:hypothetical protein Naga_100087g5 [Nannochloropsis gaditana]|uniref:Uncharacterized protein n=1 Tax=Nannochloropsis gaditana TaxID=72520 RepID=W7TQF8_9STRA|nr:hypothetical protein Naga_100087g5 [Nannochloropsis gaditana]
MAAAFVKLLPWEGRKRGESGGVMEKLLVGPFSSPLNALSRCLSSPLHASTRASITTILCTGRNRMLLGLLCGGVHLIRQEHRACLCDQRYHHPHSLFRYRGSQPPALVPFFYLFPPHSSPAYLRFNDARLTPKAPLEGRGRTDHEQDGRQAGHVVQGEVGM